MGQNNPRPRTAAERAALTAFRAAIIAAVIGGTAAIIAAVLGWFDPQTDTEVVIHFPTAALGQASTQALTATPTILPTATLTPEPRTCKPIDPSQPFSVLDHYDPSGLMGDLGDIADPWKDSQSVHIEYETRGEGPHEWDWKYKQGQTNDDPAKFGGVMFLDPPNNWGSDPEGGYDLREVSGSISWEARSLQGEVNVEFIIGGVKWIWDDNLRAKQTVPFPDSMPRKSLGVYTLNEQWRVISVPLTELKEESFRCVIGGMGVIIKWGPQGQGQKYIVELRNIYYEK